MHNIISVQGCVCTVCAPVAQPWHSSGADGLAARLQNTDAPARAMLLRTQDTTQRVNTADACTEKEVCAHTRAQATNARTP
jgi:hypothetical protein